MKIIHICAAHPSSGAGIAVTTLNKELNQCEGIESEIIGLDYSLQGFKSLRKNTIYYFFWKIRQIAQHLILKVLFKKSWIFNFNLNLTTGKKLDFQSYDIINIHWMGHNIIDFKRLIKYKGLKTKIIVTIRDMWFITGGCHYSLSCRGYKNSCKSCEASDSKLGSLFTYNQWKKKQEFLSDIDGIISISSWIYEQLSISNSNSNSVIIPTTVSSSIFKITEKGKKYTGTINLLYGSTNLNDPYKGLSYIQYILDNTKTPVTLRTFGSGQITSCNPAVTIINLGRLEQTELVDLYNLSDVLLFPSVQEAYGKVALEAMLCGLPVLCFKETGIEDLIIEDFNGIAVPIGYDNFYKGLWHLLKIKIDREAVRVNALNHCSEITTRKTIEFYESTLVRTN